MGLQQGQAKGLAGMVIQQLANGEEVAQGLGHLFALDHQIAVVHKHLGHDFAVMGAPALRDLVFMVREDQVLAAAMDIKGFAQILLAHGRAFDMPARTAAPPRRFPARLIVD